MEAVYRLPASPCTYFSKVQARQASELRINSSVGCGREFPVCQGLGKAANFLKRRPATTLKSTMPRSGSLRKCSSGRINVTSALHIPGMKLVFVSAEVAPWSKTGGLGDVLGGLPPALAARGHRVMTISPRYDQYKDAWDTDTTVEVKVGDRMEKVRFFHCYKRGVDRVFVDHPLFLAKVQGKTGGKIYGPSAGSDYVDNQLRFSLFCQAAIEAPRVLNLSNNEFFDGPFGEDVIFIANDWHTSPLPSYLKANHKSHGRFSNAKVVVCTHNIAYQGRFAASDFKYLNLPDSFLPSFAFDDGYAKPIKGPKINWMKAGFLEADKVLTVSPNYATELKAGPDTGVELDDVIRLVGIDGIVNGMDVQEWDPESDKHLDQGYDAVTVTEVKAVLKEALQAEVGLPVKDVPLLVFIGRLEEQKGSDILVAAMESMLEEEVQVIVLGTGKKHLEAQLESLETRFPGKAVGVVKFNVPLAHMMTAGADFMLVPSRFEPCGLIQLHAMRYGTIPIVASTGGLVDTVEDGVSGFLVGTFNVDCEEVDPIDVAALAEGVKKAVRTYGTPAFEQMIQTCMALDLSWKTPARKWEEALLDLQVEGSAAGSADGEEIAPKELLNVAAP